MLRTGKEETQAPFRVRRDGLAPLYGNAGEERQPWLQT